MQNQTHINRTEPTDIRNINNPIDDKEKNTRIWNYAYSTDASAISKWKTKPDSNVEHTSICGYWMIQKATELFGPMGMGWGIEITEDYFVDGPETSFIDKTSHQKEKTFTPKNHMLKIKFWYKVDNKKEKYELPSSGSTPYIYMTYNGPKTDIDYHKKSETGAIKKALSRLGIAADVYRGELDNKEYYKEKQIRGSVESQVSASDNEKTERNDLSLTIKSAIAKIEKSKTPRDIILIANPTIRELKIRQQIPNLNEIALAGQNKIAIVAQKRTLSLSGGIQQ